MIDRIIDELQRMGVAVSSTKDGHLFVFDRAWMKKLIEASDSETLAIFVKRPTEMDMS